MDILRRLEFICAFEIENSKFKHVEDVTIKATSQHKVVWSLLLVTADSKETAIVLFGLVLDERCVFHGEDVMGVSHEHLNAFSVLHQLQVFHQVVHRFVRLPSLHYHDPLRVLSNLRSTIL